MAMSSDRCQFSGFDFFFITGYGVLFLAEFGIYVFGRIMLLVIPNASRGSCAYWSHGVLLDHNFLPTWAAYKYSKMHAGHASIIFQWVRQIAFFWLQNIRQSFEF